MKLIKVEEKIYMELIKNGSTPRIRNFKRNIVVQSIIDKEELERSKFKNKIEKLLPSGFCDCSSDVSFKTHIIMVYVL